MAFRADEAAKSGYENAVRYLVPRSADSVQKKRSEEKIAEIVDAYGPAVDSYPSWHPLVSANDERYNPVTRPSEKCGYRGLDHTVHFANAFITCPYSDAQEVIDSVNALPANPVASISVEFIDEQLYNESATPILVSCQWHEPLPVDGMLPKSIVIPLLLEKELPCWRWSQFAETWETMRPYFLGTPYGSRSSLFVNQETGQTLKKIWNALINTGMYGPIKV